MLAEASKHGTARSKRGAEGAGRDACALGATVWGREGHDTLDPWRVLEHFRAPPGEQPSEGMADQHHGIPTPHALDELGELLGDRLERAMRPVVEVDGRMVCSTFDVGSKWVEDGAGGEISMNEDGVTPVIGRRSTLSPDQSASDQEPLAG